jgi:hypothetical protein
VSEDVQDGKIEDQEEGSLMCDICERYKLPSYLITIPMLPLKIWELLLYVALVQYFESYCSPLNSRLLTN